MGGGIVTSKTMTKEANGMFILMATRRFTKQSVQEAETASSSRFVRPLAIPRPGRCCPGVTGPGKSIYMTTQSKMDLRWVVNNKSSF